MYYFQPSTETAVGGLTKRVRLSGLKFENFFWLGLGLGYIMVCDVTLVCVHVQRVILIRELARVPGRIASLLA